MASPARQQIFMSPNVALARSPNFGSSSPLFDAGFLRSTFSSRQKTPQPDNQPPPELGSPSAVVSPRATPPRATPTASVTQSPHAENVSSSAQLPETAPSPALRQPLKPVRRASFDNEIKGASIASPTKNQRVEQCSIDEYEAKRTRAKRRAPPAQLAEEQEDVDDFLGLAEAEGHGQILTPNAVTSPDVTSPETPQWLRKAEVALRNTPAPLKRSRLAGATPVRTPSSQHKNPLDAMNVTGDTPISRQLRPPSLRDAPVAPIATAVTQPRLDTSGAQQSDTPSTQTPPLSSGIVLVAFGCVLLAALVGPSALLFSSATPSAGAWSDAAFEAIAHTAEATAFSDAPIAHNTNPIRMLGSPPPTILIAPPDEAPSLPCLDGLPRVPKWRQTRCLRQPWTESAAPIDGVYSPMALWPFALSIVAGVLALLAHSWDTPLIGKWKSQVMQLWNTHLSSVLDASIARLRSAAGLPAAVAKVEDTSSRKAVGSRAAPAREAGEGAKYGSEEVYRISADRKGGVSVTPVRRSKRGMGATPSGMATLSFRSPSHGIQIEAAPGVRLEKM